MSDETEHQFSRRLANCILDRNMADPDDDLAVLARHLLRADEALASKALELRRVEGDYLTYVAKTAHVEPALWSLSRAANDMLTGISVHNDRAERRGNDRIEGPVITALSKACHAAREVLAGGVKLPPQPDEAREGSQSPDDGRAPGIGQNPSEITNTEHRV